MGFFKKDQEKTEEEKRKEEIGRIVRMSEVELPGTEKFTPLPTEYKDFLREIKTKPETLYEKACSFSERFFSIKPTANMERNINNSLGQAFINATPTGVVSLTMLIVTFLSVLLAISIILGIGTMFAFFCLIIVGVLGYYFYNYPSMKSNVISLRMSSDTVLAILYMVIYMKTSPNLEGALRFTSENLKGPLAWDLKKLLWDIEVGRHASADVAFLHYIERWKERNKEFAESLHLLRNVSVEPSRREKIFSEAIKVILEGTKEKAKHYTSSLRMPMMLINAMGVMLPVMGLVLFPVVMIFMSDVVKPVMIALGYNVILPLALFLLMNHLLQMRPPTFSQPDISKTKGVPPIGSFKFRNKIIPIWPVSLVLSLPFFLLGLYGLFSSDVSAAVNYSMLIIVSVTIGISSFCILDVWQKKKIRKSIEKIEDEFSVALFQLGNQIASGTPIELAIDKAIENLKDLEIVEMFKLISSNMKKLGYTFEQALFDKNVGALRYYPSGLIESIMRTVTESSKKGVIFASKSMITISQYLKNVHTIKEDIKELLGETISSMKFLAAFLAPMVAGVTVTMAIIIIQILTNLGGVFTNLLEGASTSAAQSLLLTPWALGGEPPITPQTFQLVVGFYMLEVAVLISLFVNRVEYGDDIIGERSTLYKIIIGATFIYIASWFTVFTLFGGPMSSILSAGL